MRGFAQAAMNTTHSTFNELLPPYTVVGGNERRASTGLSAVILNRGRYSRFGFFEELEKAGFDYVLSMESSSSRYDLEDLSGSFPFIRFVLLKESVSPGEEINLASMELASPLFFVLHSDLKILRGGGAERMAERLLTKGQDSPAEASSYKRLCTVPLIQDGRSETMPTLIAPALVPEKNILFADAKNIIKTIPFIPAKEGLPSLYPFDGNGIYDRERFIRLGGFDPSIKNFYWQLMDFGFRSKLWGEEIAATQMIKLSYEGEIPEEDRTAGEDSLKFYLKNIAPVFRGDYAHIPFRRFPGYLRRRGELFDAWKEFNAGRDWVRENRYRFTSDARTIAERFPVITGGAPGPGMEGEIPDEAADDAPDGAPPGAGGEEEL